MNDGYVLDPATGSITLSFGKKTYTLPAPDFGQWRQFSVLNEKRIEAEMQILADMTVDTVEQAPDDEDPAEVAEVDVAERVRARMAESLDAVRQESRRRDELIVGRFAFWREACDIWGIELPKNDDKLPPWLGNATLIDEAVGHWINFPFRVPGGSVAAD